jgi:hypothetical protein
MDDMKADSQPESARPLSRPVLLGFILVAIIGIILRVYPSAGFTGIGFDEGLYRNYVTHLINHGVTSYPDFAEHYVERQQKLETVILPPTRFLYIFSAYLWHEITGADALLSLHEFRASSASCCSSPQQVHWRLAGPAWALRCFALMAAPPPKSTWRSTRSSTGSSPSGPRVPLASLGKSPEA